MALHILGGGRPLLEKQVVDQLPQAMRGTVQQVVTRILCNEFQGILRVKDNDRVPRLMRLGAMCDAHR